MRRQSFPIESAQDLQRGPHRLSTHWAWPSCEGMWTALRRRRQSPLGGSESMDDPAESLGHFSGMLGNEGREMGTAGAPECMLAQPSAARRHLQCRLYAILGKGYGHTSSMFSFIKCCTVFMVQSLLLFLVRLFWHFVNGQLVQASWLLGLHCASCFWTEDYLLKAGH